MENNYPANLEALHSESVAHRLMRVVLWTIGFIIARLLVNNAIGFCINREYVIPTTQSSIPKVGTALLTLCPERTVFNFFVNLGDFAANFFFPAAMSFLFVWFGWKIASFGNLAGYGVAAAVYYIMGPQATNGETAGLNGLPYYVMIPAVSFAVCLIAQMIFNLIAAKDPLKIYVKPCYSAKNAPAAADVEETETADDAGDAE